jgi:ribonuclease BN (tRNA processing enzyme)
MHADHCNGFAQLTHWKHLVTRPKPPRLSSLNRDLSWYKDEMRWPPKDQWDSSSQLLTIYVPAGVENNIRQYLKEVFMRPEITTEFDLSVVPYGKGLVHKDKTLSITAYANTHIRSYYPELKGTDAVRDSYSLLVEIGDKKCLYTSDIGALRDIEGIAEQADLVFLEGAHPSPEEILDFVKRVGLKRVIVVHILVTREEAFASLKADLARANVELSHDGFEVEL